MNSRKTSQIGFVIAIISVAVLWFAYGIIVHQLEPDWQTRGQFGDTFGALNTLFTGWAFVGVLFTLFQQSREIEEGREKIEEQRAIQKKTEEMLLKQVEALSITARVNALTARISGYNVQLTEVDDSGQRGLRDRLVRERHNLFLRLDEVLRSQGD